MADAQLQHDQPRLTEEQALVALLAEAFEVARDVELAQRAMKEKSGAELDALIQSVGLPEELQAAADTAQKTVLRSLARLSEEALETGRDNGFLSAEDCRAAIKAKRTLSLARGRSKERDQGLER